METVYVGEEQRFSVSIDIDADIDRVDFSIVREEDVLIDIQLGDESRYEESDSQVYYYDYAPDEVGKIIVIFTVTFDDEETEQQEIEYFVEEKPIEPTWTPSYPPNIYVDTEPWAISNHQEWAREALLTFGERAILRLRWRWEHEDAGLVTRCYACYKYEKVADVYKQAGDSRCENCYGIGFDKGFRPHIYYMHVNINYDTEERSREESGEIVTHNPQAQFIWTPRLTAGDILIRAEWKDDTPVKTLDRYILRNVELSELRAGPKGELETVVVGQNCTIDRVHDDHVLYNVPVG